MFRRGRVLGETFPDQPNHGETSKKAAEPARTTSPIAGTDRRLIAMRTRESRTRQANHLSHTPHGRCGLALDLCLSTRCAKRRNLAPQIRLTDWCNDKCAIVDFVDVDFVKTP